jgi:site-specific DNA recombinase
MCKGRHIPAAVLDDIIVSNLMERLFTPDRLATLLQGLVDRQATKREAVDDRLRTLQREVQETEERLKRLYRSVDDGVIELDDILRERTMALKSERERAKAALGRARSQAGERNFLDAEKIDVFARLMTEKLKTGDVNGRKAYIRAVVSAIEVDDKTIRIIGCKDTLQAAIAAKQTANENVRGLVSKVARPKRFELLTPRFVV